MQNEYDSGDQINQDGRDGARGAYGGDKTCIERICEEA
jgi:hypothetical protein